METLQGMEKVGEHHIVTLTGRCDFCDMPKEKAQEKPDCIFCICHSWDGRGRSVCGFPCRMHPPEHKCLTCNDRMVAKGRSCAHCDFTVNGCEE